MSRRELAMAMLVAWEQTGVAQGEVPEVLAKEAWAVAGEYIEALDACERKTTEAPSTQWTHGRRGLA